MMYLLLAAAVIGGGYFALRFCLIKHALREADKELQEIQKDISQNQILHLPMPDRELEKFMNSINNTLEEVRKERQSYEKREKAFQEQIENISHDLRTPLTVILGYLKFMEASEDAKDSAIEREDTLKIIEKKARSMERLVTQFYEFSQLNARQYEIKLHRADACRILRETLAGSYQILEAAHLEVAADLPEHPIWVKGEEGALERIFSNLIQNAGRYAVSFLRISITTEQEKTVVTFTNDAEKITENEVPHLFDRFHMQSNFRNQGGTGLGLTIAKYLAEAMGGMLEADVLTDVPAIVKTTDNSVPLPSAARHKKADDERSIICFTLTLKNHAKCII